MVGYKNRWRYNTSTLGTCEIGRMDQVDWSSVHLVTYDSRISKSINRHLLAFKRFENTVLESSLAMYASEIDRIKDTNTFRLILIEQEDRVLRKQEH